MANTVEIDIDLNTRQAQEKLKRFLSDVDKFRSSAGSGFDKIDGSVNNVTTSIKKLGSQSSSNFSKLNSSLDKTNKNTSALNLTFASFAGNLLSQGVSRGVQLISSFLNKAAEDAIAFDKGLREINTILPATEKVTEATAKQLRNLSVEFGTSKAAQAKSFYQIVSAGITDAAQATKLLTNANKLALGGISSVESSVDILTDILNVYGQENISAAEAADSLFTTVRLGKTTISELSSSIGQVLPAANQLGIGLDTIGAALAELTTKGLSTSERTTQLNALFTSLFRNSGDASAKFGKKVGDAFSIAALKTKGLATFLEDLIVATDGSEITLQKLLGRTEAVKAVFGLAGSGVDGLRSKLDQYGATAKGAADAASAEQTGGLGFQLEKLGGIFVEAITPANSFTQAIARGVQQMNRFFKSSDDGFDSDQLSEFRGNAIKISEELDRLNQKLENTVRLRNKNQKLGRDTFFQEEEIVTTQKQISQAEKLKIEVDDVEAQNKIASLKISIAEIQKQRTKAQDPIFANLVASDEELKKEEERLQQQLDNISNLQLLAADKLREEKAIKDAEAAQSELDSKIQKKQLLADFDAIAKEDEIAFNEEEALAKQLANDADFLALEEKLGREEALRELNRISQIESEKQRIDELKKLQKRADAEFIKRTETQNAAELKLEQQKTQAKLNIAQSGANLAEALAGKNNKAIFALQKAIALAQVIVSGAAAEGAALAPPPLGAGPIAGAALVPLIRTNTVLQAATIATTAVKGFQDGGVIGGPISDRDNTIIGAAGGEVMLNRKQQAETLFRIANGGGGNLGGGESSISFNIEAGIGGVTEEQTDMIIEAINTRTEFGNNQVRAS